MPENPENDRHDTNDQVDPSIAKGSIDKLNAKDPALDLIKKPLINRKVLQIAASVVGLAVLIGLGFGLQAPRPKAAQAKDKGKQEFAKQVPSDLTINPEDYAGIRPEAVRNASLQPYSVSPNASQVSGKAALPQYGTYTHTPTTEQNAQYPDQQQPPQPQGQTANEQPAAKNSPLVINPFSVSPSDEEAKRRLAALTSGFFFPWNTVDQQTQAAKQKAAAQQEADQQTQAQTNAIASAYESTYSKQNMAKEKQTFLASQQADYSAYLDNHYLSPVDAAHLLQAGTLIPITMETSIDSDLPGTILSQINENVFDTLSGDNILIPRGSKLIGTYDNSIAFGQDRVLVVWNRLIRTDGISISLRGMHGTDLQGKSGLHDQVEYHLATLLAVIGASTAFNIGTNAAIAAMSTNQFLSSLASAMTAQGSTSSNVTSAATSAAATYANKLIDQQPTIIIREGTSAYCLIDKDMILPAFVDQDGGYMPVR